MFHISDKCYQKQQFSSFPSTSYLLFLPLGMRWEAVLLEQNRSRLGKMTPIFSSLNSVAYHPF